MHKTPYVVPIVGQRKIEHLKSNIEALSIDLSQEDLDEIDGAAPFDPGFPNTFFFQEVNYGLNLTASDVFFTKAVAHIDVPPHQAPVKPRQI
jgi:hypothetical protein